MLKKAFTLIELLAVIIILAIVALIATPIVLNVVNSAKDSAMRSQLSLYADSVKIQLTQGYLTNGGKYSSVINLEDDNLDKSINCEEVYYTQDSKVLLGNCTMKGYSGNYWYVNGEIGDEKPADFDTLKANTIASNGEITIIEYVDNSGANKPELYDKMIPVIYKENNWVYADIKEKWYDYDAKEWANAVVLNDGVTKNVGNIIDVGTDVSLMFVWIPRYKYTIFNGNNGTAYQVQPINIVFETGIAKTGTVTCTTETSGSGLSSEICIDSTNGSIVNRTSTYTHPAFTFGTQELTGTWVGKFENSAPSATSNSVQKVTIKPNVRSWAGATASTFYNSILNLKTDYGMNDIDSHMMKNMEWGAVAYLTQSKYGRCDNGTCTEIAKNDSSDHYTGRSLGRPSSADEEYSRNGTYTYEVSLGQQASTTGNIYGIYDMSGGISEIVMGNMVHTCNQFYSSSAGFSTNPLSKHYDAYTYNEKSIGSTNGGTYTTNSRGKLGDATKETIRNVSGNSDGWYSDASLFPSATFPWFNRGSNYGQSFNAGVFSFTGSNGSVSDYTATRAVVVSAE